MIYNNLNELIADYIDNPFTTEEEKEIINNSSMVIEDFIPAGQYTILSDGRIIIKDKNDEN